MYLRMLCLTLGVGLGLTVLTEASDTNLSASENARIEQEVVSANEQMNKAAESLDVGKFFDWILDEAKGPIIQDGRLFQTREEAKAAVERGYQGVRTLNRTFDQTFVTVLSKESALVSSSGVSRIALMDGRSFEAPFAVSLVFVLRDGQWKVLQGHYSTPNR
ncbi:MAG: nuclear transport factor 2 family protein [Acidobacteriota bacterium]